MPNIDNESTQNNPPTETIRDLKDLLDELDLEEFNHEIDNEQTIHSAQEEPTLTIPITEKPINQYDHQIILNESNNVISSFICNTERIFLKIRQNHNPK